MVVSGREGLMRWRRVKDPLCYRFNLQSRATCTAQCWPVAGAKENGGHCAATLLGVVYIYTDIWGSLVYSSFFLSVDAQVTERSRVLSALR